MIPDPSLMVLHLLLRLRLDPIPLLQLLVGELAYLLECNMLVRWAELLGDVGEHHEIFDIGGSLLFGDRGLVNNKWCRGRRWVVGGFHQVFLLTGVVPASSFSDISDNVVGLGVGCGKVIRFVS